MDDLVRSGESAEDIDSTGEGGGALRRSSMSEHLDLEDEVSEDGHVACSLTSANVQDDPAYDERGSSPASGGGREGRSPGRDSIQCVSTACGSRPATSSRCTCRGYNPDDYANLPVDADVRQLFQFINDYEPMDVELDVALKPFIPDYIPSVGDLDAFIKVCASGCGE
jgi:hypothetical protein